MDFKNRRIAEIVYQIELMQREIEQYIEEYQDAPESENNDDHLINLEKSDKALRVVINMMADEMDRVVEYEVGDE